MTVSFDNPLRRRQGRQSHGPTSVKLLSGDAELGPQTQLAAIGETGGGIDHDDGGIDSSGEAVHGGDVLGEDCLRVPGGPLRDVGDGLFQVGYHSQRQIETASARP